MLEQLIVGVLLFTPLLLLLPTTLVFFCFASLLHSGYLCVQTVAVAAAAALRANPAYSIVHRLLDPAACPSGIWLEALPPPTHGNRADVDVTDVAAVGQTQYLRMETIPYDLAFVLDPCWAEVRAAAGIPSVFQRLASLLHDWSTSII